MRSTQGKCYILQGGDTSSAFSMEGKSKSRESGDLSGSHVYFGALLKKCREITDLSLFL